MSKRASRKKNFRAHDWFKEHPRVSDFWVFIKDSSRSCPCVFVDTGAILFAPLVLAPIPCVETAVSIDIFSTLVRFPGAQEHLSTDPLLKAWESRGSGERVMARALLEWPGLSS
jgi:hypothetical protein